MNGRFPYFLTPDRLIRGSQALWVKKTILSFENRNNWIVRKMVDLLTGPD